MKKNRRIKPAGFTLIEVLVVISIIGFISTAAITMLNSARIKARDAKVASDVKQIITGLELYKDSNPDDKYPDSQLGGGGEVCLGPSSVRCWGFYRGRDALVS